MGLSLKQKTIARLLARRLEPVFFFVVLVALGVTFYRTLHPSTAPLVGDVLEVTVFDVGQGDAILVEAGATTQMLIDGGPDDAVLAKLGESMPVGDREIELVVLTHPHLDHFMGLMSVFERYAVHKIMMTDLENPTEEYRAFIEGVRDKKIIIESSELRDFAFGNAHVEVLFPRDDLKLQRGDEPNAASIVLKITKDKKTILLAGDIEATGEEAMVRAGENVRADILKVGHHGSRTSSTSIFLDAVRPRYAVISVGENSYGHPHLDVVHRMAERGIEIFRTDRDGDVFVRTDGTTLEVVSGQ